MMSRYSRTLFLAAVSLLPVVQGPRLAVGRYPIQISDVLFIGSGLLLAVSWAMRRVSPSPDRFFLHLGAYAAGLAVATLLSEDFAASLLKFSGEIYLMLVSALAFELIRAQPDMLRQTVLAWLAGTAVVALFALSGTVLFYAGYDTQATNPLLSHFGSLPSGPYPRIRSVFANANMMANYLNISLSLLLLAGASGWLSAKTSKLAAVGTWFAALVSLSPGLGGMLLSSGIWLRSRGGRFATTVFAASVVGSALFLGATLVSPDTPNTDRGIVIADRTIEPSVRVLVWESAIDTIRTSPWFGRGVGIDPAAVRYETLSGDRQFLRDAHNMLLNVTGQSGLLGLCAFVGLLVFLFGRVRGAGTEGHALLSAFVGAVLYQGLTGSFENARHVWVLFGMMAAVGGRVTTDADSAQQHE